MGRKLDCYLKVCSSCDCPYKTIQRFSKVCPDCKARNHTHKIKRGLFGDKVGEI